ncbi:phage head morphogenesis protein [Halobacillus salinarum]|uniref:Phage head morphogenesis protein n=1 Tax=Halobacillus salinarum TaxID=2932257 RepID=A0ABY4EMM4_9BACI|nr:phage minor head protein [Halobacillus salinarum]UOQ43361.1 phage head morphogenesis protein [Halobacillus salinarum]
MDKKTAERMNLQVMKFMSSYGFYPAMKDREEEILSIEDRLSNRLFRAQVGLESSFIQALREKGYLPGNPAEQKALIDLIMEAPFEQMSEIISEEGLVSAATGRQLTADDIAEQGVEIALSEFSDQATEELKNRIYTFSKDTFERIKGDFAGTLAAGFEEGVGIDEAARSLRADFSHLRDYRLRTIARTEVQGAQNEGIERTMQDYDVQYKQWLTVGDRRVRGRDSSDRYDHVSLHGEVVRRDERFSNGLMRPLDRSGPIGEWINCRCRMRPYLPKKNETILTTPYYPMSA